MDQVHSPSVLSSHFDETSTACASQLGVLWQQMVAQACVCNDPLVRGLLATGIRSHSDFASALAALLGRKLGDRSVAADALTELVAEGFEAQPEIVCAAAADMVAIRERDPACPDFVTPFLFFKGFHAVQSYRVAHWLWLGGRRHLALHLQSRASELFGVDIHPAAQLGRRILFDHGTGIVVGETCIIEDDVSLLQEVTLGGTGKHSGDRHPKVRRGVLIGAGAKVLGNIELGEGAKIGAGSIVLESVPPFTTVVGNPARKVGTRHSGMPALTMDQMLPPIDYII
ncbi:serine O-acetyltransferase [Acetobacter indonesiensis NRIC 0313]|jgi:serine O-acetyltransferase|uniref:Serine acetyltransferase n=1 Tax=Acetobacter indonesiensis TaxID=104101 RepID=A0A252AYW5_9PROT|nr:serine O-acetyltransferase [Acetobacter indonesiensis]MCG0993869.1 serine O-acetyltransferase [Acetobacter indonesiensis]MCI1438224.1 serine O-acetyltransferase [Acetobacter indonesiensis]MCI1545492.1 serine O-acetyltransferase [Acetobacter indonesiensis]MCI1764771.1 serine O-acetyltransferase [Acetobacter indonesiensis]MCP1231148.1 serine O-acetyltransferase [Acetobacter indonesiensis]